MVDLIKDNIIKKTPDVVKSKYPGGFFLDNATGVVFVSSNSPQYVSGQIRIRGRKNGQYPFGYKEILEEIFGKCSSCGEEIEVCSGWVKKKPNLMTVDINPDRDPIHIGDGNLCRLIGPTDLKDGIVILHIINGLQRRCMEPSYHRGQNC